jgi:hypothetical protein
MAASIWPAVDDRLSPISDRSIAVNIAREILEEVDRQMPKEPSI